MSEDKTLVAIPISVLKGWQSDLEDIIKMIQDYEYEEEIIDTAKHVSAQLTYFIDIHRRYDVRIVSRGKLYDMGT